MEFSSGFASSIDRYLQYREGMHYGGLGEKSYLKSFDKYCSEFYPDKTSLTKDVVRGWFFEEISKGHLSLENKATTIRMFARFLGSSVYVLPMNCVPKVSQYVPYIMTDRELSSFFEAADHLSIHRLTPFVDEAMPFMLRIIYSCGLRPGEATRLKIDDVDLNTGEIFIRNTKRHKDRIIVASNDAIKLLRSFDVRRKVAIGKSEYFFCTDNGSSISRWYVDSSVKECWRAANPGIDPKELPRVRAYDLRHRFASAVLQGWIDEGKNLYVMLPYLRAYMGHQSFSDTVYYIHLLPDRLMESPGINWEKIDRIGLEVDLWKD